jgi:Protein of unknown function (DUF1643)
MAGDCQRHIVAWHAVLTGLLEWYAYAIAATAEKTNSLRAGRFGKIGASCQETTSVFCSPGGQSEREAMVTLRKAPIHSPVAKNDNNLVMLKRWTNLTSTMDSGAVISDCGRYRYSLWRIWNASAVRVMFIGLNPSTADATQDDPTIRRCVEFARSWGFGGIYVQSLRLPRHTSGRNEAGGRSGWLAE